MKRFVVAGILIGLIAPVLIGGGFVAGRAARLAAPTTRPLLVLEKTTGDWHDVSSKTSFIAIARVTALCVLSIPQRPHEYPVLDPRMTCRDTYEPVANADEERLPGDRARGAATRACWESATVGEALPDCWR